MHFSCSDRIADMFFHRHKHARYNVQHSPFNKTEISATTIHSFVIVISIPITIIIVLITATTSTFATITNNLRGPKATFKDRH